MEKAGYHFLGYKIPVKNMFLPHEGDSQSNSSAATACTAPDMQLTPLGHFYYEDVSTKQQGLASGHSG